MRTLLPFFALAIIIASGSVQGLWTGRWSNSRALEVRVEKLGLIPREVGDWKGRDLPVDARMMAHAEVAGHLMRRYENHLDGAAVTVLMVCGRPGPIAVHTPEVCYGGIGYQPSAPRSKHMVEDEGTSGDEVWALELSKPASALEDRLRILYGWSIDGTWKASESPRLDFVESPVLTKLYIVRSGAKSGKAVDDHPEDRFVRTFLPLLRETLFAKP